MIANYSRTFHNAVKFAKYFRWREFAKMICVYLQFFDKNIDVVRSRPVDMILAYGNVRIVYKYKEGKRVLGH